MKTATKILDTLQTSGYRLTKARQAVCLALAKSACALTIQELAERVSVDEASVYRTVALLQKENLVEEILIKDERPHYSFNTHHHHHAVCTDCGRVEHLPCNEEPRPPKQVTGFTSLDGHDLTFYGLCVRCS